MSNEKVQNWKAKIDELRLQMHLGSSEASEEFEKQKKKLNIWAHESLIKLEKLQASGKGEFIKLKTDLEELQLQAALGRAEAKDSLHEQQKNLSKKLHEVDKEIEKSVNSTEKALVSFAIEADHAVQDFRTKFDLFKLQFELGKSEAKDFWNDKKKELSVKLQEMDHKVDQMKDEAEHKWDGFSGEMKEAWAHIRKAFN